MELLDKLKRVRGLAERHSLDAILLQRVSSVAWATGGAAVYVNTARSEGEAHLLITGEKQFFITNNIEAARLQKEEEAALKNWDFLVVPWYKTNHITQELTKGLRVGTDGLSPGALDLSDEIARLRADLTAGEGERFRVLGQLCAGVMDAAIRELRPGHTEFDIAGLVAGEAERHGVQVIVNLVATDERIFNFRHPLPTAKRLERYAMLAFCGRRRGLVCSITRLVHFGRLPEEIRKKALATASVDAVMIAGTRPGRTLGEIFQMAVDEYSRLGFPDEWRLHHQGGPAGYEPREYFARPGASEKVSAGQVYAWNPSITGTKSEDTILVGETANEILTSIPGWPMINIELDDRALKRPAILVID